MLRPCGTGDADTLAYCLDLVLLYAQSVVKIVALKSTDAIVTPEGLHLSPGKAI